MRTDIHRPSAAEFDPANYEFVGCFDLHPEEGDQKARRETVNRYVSDGYRFFASDGCGHCGARIRYAALLLHPSTKEMLYIGETCLDNRFTLSASEFQHLRETARLNRERATRSERALAFRAENPIVDELLAYELEVEALPNFLFSLITQFEKNGFLSEKQVAAIRPAIEKDRVAIARAKVEEVRKESLISQGVSAPEGRATHIVSLVATKLVESDFGSSLKMLVEHASGWKAWLSMPAGLEAEIGDSFAITATFTRSADDALFAFGKRPTLPKKNEETK